MNRRTRTLVVLGVSVLLAGVAAFAVYRAVQQIPVREIPIVERQQVVAVEAIPVGVMISKEQVKLAPWPADSPLENGFTSLDDVIGRGVTGSFVANEPIIDTKLASREAGGGMPPMIPQGLRAMSLRVNDVVSVAGYTTPGTRVDVVVTSRGGRSGDDPMSRTVLSNIQVLAAGTRYEEDRARKEPIPTNVVTLLVTPEDGEKLTLAMQQGQINLALRNPLDVMPTETPGIRLSSLLNAPGGEPVKQVVRGQTRLVAPKPPPPPPPPPSITIINGTESKTQTVKPGSGGAGSF